MELTLAYFQVILDVLRRHSKDPLAKEILKPYQRDLPEIMALFSKAAVAHYILESQITSDNETSVARQIENLRWAHEEAYSHLALFKRIQKLECHRLASPHALGNSPIHSLPVELLSYVFTLLIPNATPFLTAAQQAEPSRAICSVSRLWRDTAQNHTPTLWTTVSTHYTFQRLFNFLQRSKTSPLHSRIVIHPTAGDHLKQGTSSEQALSLLLSQLSRVRTLDILCISSRTGFPENDLAILREARDAVMDRLAAAKGPFMLEHLKLSGGNMAHMGLPENLFGQASTRLHTVYIQMCRSVNPALFHAPLNNLTIHRTSAWSTLDEIATDFETFLSTINTPRRSVLLSRLRTLKLTAQLEYVGLIMNRLVLSTTTAIVVDGRFFGPPSLGVEFNTMLDNLDDGFESHLGGLQEGYRRLSLSEYKGRAYKGFNLTAHAYERNDHAAEPPRFQYGATYHDFDVDHVRGYIAMLARIVCWPGLGSSIVRLEVAKRRLPDRTWQWGHILEDLPNLEEVVIDGPAGRAFVSAMRYPADAPRCPRLQSVVLRETKLMSKFVDRLIDHLVKQRVPHGCSLLHLSFSQCSISIADVERLGQTQGVADDLSWDGAENGWESWRMKWAFQGIHNNPADEYESDSSDDYMPMILDHFE